jgi:Fe2+ or Zn2+ uptake regulation protein
MSSEAKLFEEHLRKHGYSVTKSRQTVFNALANQEAMSMHDILGRLKGSVDRASLYRTVALFEKLGIAHRLQQGWKYKIELTDQFHYHHHHFTCTNCGLIIALREDPTIEASILILAREYGTEPSSHQLEIQGLCPACQKIV